MAETRELQEKLNGQVALNEAVEDQLELCGTRLRDWGRRQKRADAKLEKAEEKHTEHLRLRGEWADEVKLLRDGKAQAETELQESRTREAALRQALMEATAAWEEQAGDAAALKAQQAALRQELTEVEERYFGLAMELKNQDADIRRTKRACLGRFRDLPVGGGDDRLPGLPRTPTEANLTRSEVAADEYATPLGTAGTTEDFDRLKLGGEEGTLIAVRIGTQHQLVVMLDAEAYPLRYETKIDDATTAITEILRRTLL